MEEEDLQQIHRAVCRYLRQHRGLGRLTPDRHTDLVRFVEEQFRGDLPDETELHCAALVCALGPVRPGPALAIVDAVVEVAQGLELATARLPEVAIAFGCGRWRDVLENGGSWAREWAGALQQLILALEPPVRESNIWLSEHLVGFPEAGRWHNQIAADFITHDAHLLAVHLTRPTRALHFEHDDTLCINSRDDETVLEASPVSIGGSYPAGSRAVFEASAPVRIEVSRGDGGSATVEVPAATVFAVRAVDDGTRIMLPRPQSDILLQNGDSARVVSREPPRFWLCGCGNRNCAGRHRLAAWNANSVSLWSFLSSAVKGPSTTLRFGAFVTGMYLPVLSREGTFNGVRVRPAEVEYKLCQDEACTSKDPQRKYEGERCLCKAAFNPAVTPRDKFERLIVVGDVAHYRRETRIYCREQHGRLKSGNLYLCHLDQCPICGTSPRTRRPTHIWVRTFGRAVPLDVAEASG